MTTTTKIVLVAGSLLGTGLLASLFVKRRQRNPMTAVSNPVRVGARGGTRDWWLARNEKRRQKHIRMMTAKG